MQGDEIPDKEKIGVLGPLGLQTREGWIFPSYMADRCPGLPHYEALYGCAQAFATEDTFPRGRMIVYPPGWDIGTQSRELAAMLELPFEPVTSASAPRMITDFQHAAKEGKSILMTFRAPYRLLAEVDIDWVTWDTDEGRCVDASGQTRGSACGIPQHPGSIVKVANREVAAKWPGAHRLLAEMTIDNATRNALMVKQYQTMAARVESAGVKEPARGCSTKRLTCVSWSKSLTSGLLRMRRFGRRGSTSRRRPWTDTRTDGAVKPRVRRRRVGSVCKELPVAFRFGRVSR